ncbi:MAG: sensor histidine kinase [Roseimicrobium sp.]
MQGALRTHATLAKGLGALRGGWLALIILLAGHPSPVAAHEIATGGGSSLPTIWETHRNAVIVTIIFGMIQTALIAGLLVANSRIKRLVREKDERLRFKRVLMEISADLVEASTESLDQTIGRALEKVRVTMDLQSCMLFEHMHPSDAIRILYHTDHIAGETATRTVQEQRFPWLCEQFQGRRPLPLTDATRELPDEAVAEHEYVKARNIKSALVIPLHGSDGITRGVSFCTASRFQDWTEPLVSQLHALGDVLSSSVSRHRAETELRLSEERFSKAFHGSPSAMAILRAKDVAIIDVNESWEKQLGYTYAESVGRLPEELGFYRSERERAELGAHVNASGSLRNHEMVLRTRAGNEITTMLSLETITIHDEACCIAILHDITDQRQMEEIRQSMVHVSRLALVGELTASIAHEINQPLGAILSNAEAAEMLMEKKDPPLDDIRQILADIRKDDLRASQVIRHIRTLVRRSPLQLMPVQANDVVADVLKLLSTDAQRRGMLLRSELAPDAPVVPADRVHLQQVLINLIVNAMDAMKSTPSSGPAVLVQTRREGAGVSVSVRDHGHGIPENRLPQIFESFFTTKVEGMGLGLAMARSIVEAHRGSIAARNHPEGGAVFTFSLPGAQPLERSS